MTALNKFEIYTGFCDVIKLDHLQKENRKSCNLLQKLNHEIISKVVAEPLSDILDMNYTEISKETVIMANHLNLDIQLEGFDSNLFPLDIFPSCRREPRYPPGVSEEILKQRYRLLNVGFAQLPRFEFTILDTETMSTLKLRVGNVENMDSDILRIKIKERIEVEILFRD